MTRQEYCEAVTEAAIALIDAHSICPIDDTLEDSPEYETMCDIIEAGYDE